MTRILTCLGALMLSAGCMQGTLTPDEADRSSHDEREPDTATSVDDSGSDGALQKPTPCGTGRDASRCAPPDADTGDDAAVDESVCGNGRVEGDEQCDDGNTDREACAYGQKSCQVCGPNCRMEAGTTRFCGDGKRTGREECDDGNTSRERCAYGETNCTVCGPDCKRIDGRTHFCGDGVIQKGSGEECDDEATAPGDGCGPKCRVESGYTCTGAPSDCSPAPSPGHGDAKCEPSYGASVYDAFPGNNAGYPKGDASAYGWTGDDFESYADNEIVETRTNKRRRSHLEVTSGTLRAKHLNGSRLWKRGWTDTYNFRVLSRTTSGGKQVRVTDVAPAIRVYIDDWQSGGPQWSGAHIFARYQTENDLYVASLRKDGKVYIKLKHCDSYTTLAGAKFSQGPLQTGNWYDLRFEVVGQRLRLYVDGKLELEAFDDTLSWGTTGIRTDYASVYFDDWEHR